MNLRPSIYLRIFSAILALYPVHFRSEFEDEMLAVFAEKLKDQAGREPVDLMITCLREYSDIFLNLVNEYMAELRQGQAMNNLFNFQSPGRVILWGCLVFGVLSGLQNTYGILTGLYTLEFSKYSLLNVIISFLSTLIFNLIVAGLFWQGIPQPKSKWGFLIPAIGTSFLTWLTIGFNISYLVGVQIHNQADYIFWAFGRPTINAFLWGFVFGGLFGWAYRGRRAALSFAIIGAIGKVASFLIWQGSISLTYALFKIMVELPLFSTTNPWFIVWNIILTILGGIAFGALLGWMVSRFGQEGGINPRMA